MADYDVIIIGGGPAGFSAAIYTSRANLSTLMLEGMQPGGQLTTTSEVENFAGFPDGIQGTQLMNNMREQAKRFGTVDKFELVSRVDTSSRPFKVFVGETLYTSEAIIIATGAHAKYLGLENEQRLIGKGVSACATCDAFFFKGKEVVVIGGGDSAMEEANHLAKFATKVTIIHRSEKFRASPIMLERTQKNSKIEFLMNTQVVDVLGDGVLSGLKLKDTVTGEESDFVTQGLFLAIGHAPNTELFKDLLDMDHMGYIHTKPDSTQTNVEGVFAAGDVQDHVYRQAITAAGSGCMSALEAQRWIDHKRHEENSHD